MRDQVVGSGGGRGGLDTRGIRGKYTQLYFRLCVSELYFRLCMSELYFMLYMSELYLSLYMSCTPGYM